ncbi:MAG TPA: hypothetical protein VJ720_04285, partial [Chitinophaga sp.]|nr:hypothetical protein [Chitinophaga sp.]
MCRKTVVFFAILIYHLSVFGQQLTPNPTSPSANLGTSLEALQVSNDLYNGKMNVSIPIYSYEFEGMLFPISLSYSGGNGIKPDELPGLVGYGWNLQLGGGYIHRTVRGKPDEARDFKTTIGTATCGFTAVTKKTELLSDFSYLSNLSKLNNSNWTTSQYVASVNSSSNASFTVPSGCRDLTYCNVNPIYDLVPDEFSFSMGNVSGKFYLSSNNEWVFSSSDGQKYKVELTTGEQLIRTITGNSITYNYRSPNIIKRITLTSPGGMKYYFGNTNPSASENELLWDHSRSSTQAYSPPTPPDDPSNTYLDLAPHTWHLSKIENTKTGSIIMLNYKQQGLHYYKSSNIWGNGAESSTFLI